jgi:hypothetical protein
MKNILINYLLLICLIMFQLSLPSCKKFVENEGSPNLIESELLFETESGALSAVSGVYLQLRVQSPAYANGSLSVYGGLSADELVAQSAFNEYQAFYNNAVLPTSSVVNNQLWSTAYKVIYRTNAIIEGLEKSGGLALGTQKQLIAEMKVLRAFTYFNLINLFGAVPLIISTNYNENEKVARTPEAAVYRFIVEDLVRSLPDLTEEYPTLQRVRINQYAAAALLARVYLYMGDWNNAERYSSLVISSGSYRLLDELDLVFQNSSDETIWQLAPQNDNRNTVEGSFFIPASSRNIPNLFLQESLLNSFEDGDSRKSFWVGSSRINGKEYAYPYKYKLRINTPVEEYTVVLRLAEQYLIRSEAFIRQNKVEEALLDLNTIRRRAGLADIESENEADILDAIVRERKLELFAEFGHRWFDLKRTGLINTVLAPIKGANWQETDQYYPIPFTELQINPALEQNPGY